MKMWRHVVVPASTAGGLHGHERCRSSCSRKSAPSFTKRPHDLTRDLPEETPNYMLE